MSLEPPKVNRGLVRTLDPKDPVVTFTPEQVDAAITPKVAVKDLGIGEDKKNRLSVDVPMRMFRDHDNVKIVDTVGDDGKRIFAVYSDQKGFVCSFNVPQNADIRLNIQKDPLRPNHGTLTVCKEHGRNGSGDIGTLLINEPKGAVKIDRFVGNDAQHIALDASAVGSGNSERRNTLEKRTNTRESHEERMAKAQEQLQDKSTHYAAKQDMRKIRKEEMDMDIADHKEDRAFMRKAKWAAHKCAMEEAREARVMAREYCSACHMHPAQARQYCNMQAMGAYQQSFQMALGRAQESLVNLQGDFAGMQQGGHQPQIAQGGGYGVAPAGNVRTAQPPETGSYGVTPNIGAYTAPGMNITGYQPVGVGLVPLPSPNGLQNGFGVAPTGGARR